MRLHDNLDRRIKVSFASDVRRTQVDDIPVLAPGQRVVMPMEIVLSGSGGKLGVPRKILLGVQSV